MVLLGVRDDDRLAAAHRLDAGGWLEGGDLDRMVMASLPRRIAAGSLNTGRWPQNSADRTRWLSLAGYDSGALSFFVAIDCVAIARLTVTTVAAILGTYVSAS